MNWRAPRDRRADARPFRNDRHLLEVDRAIARSFSGASQSGVMSGTSSDRSRLTPLRVERAGALGTDGAMPEKLHPFLPCRINRFNAYKNLCIGLSTPRTAATISELGPCRACDIVTRWWAISRCGSARYQRLHDRLAGDSATLGSGRFETGRTRSSVVCGERGARRRMGWSGGRVERYGAGAQHHRAWTEGPRCAATCSRPSSP